MSVALLDRIRRINRLLHENVGSIIVFSDVCEAMGEALSSEILVLSRKGKILGRGGCDGNAPSTLLEGPVGSVIEKNLNERLLNILSTQENVHLEMLGFSAEENRTYRTLVAPIFISGDRLGTFLIYRRKEDFGVDDIILAEYGAAVVGLELIRSLSEEAAAEMRGRQIVRSALGTLSSSEAEAVKYILEELDGKEGILVASKVADRVGITRSVIVNALRKLESAGVIESRSSGMRGTYIRVTNELLAPEIASLCEKEECAE